MAISMIPIDASAVNNTEQRTKKIAMFIDLPNINRSLKSSGEGMQLDFDKLVGRVQEEGNLAVGKCYMEMHTKNEDNNGKEASSSYPYRGFKVCPIDMFLNKIYSLNIEPIYAPHTESKSLSDPMLITDAMECLHEKNFIDLFVLVTSDRDVIPLMKKIIERDKECIIIGIAENTSEFLIKQIGIMGTHFEELTNNFTRIRIRATAMR